MNVIFEERHAPHGYRIGIASLDAAASLNALSLPMIEALDAKLKAWAHDPGIACVLLRGNGPKAFCAGGDVVQLVHQCREHPGKSRPWRGASSPTSTASTSASTPTPNPLSAGPTAMCWAAAWA